MASTKTKPKTVFLGLVDTLLHLLSEIPVASGYTEEAVEQFPVKVAAIHGKPWLNIGPFWVKTKLGTYQVGVWNKELGEVEVRLVISLTPKDEINPAKVTYHYQAGYDAETWWPTKPKQGRVV
jgi:hypothetical protein